MEVNPVRDLVYGGHDQLCHHMRHLILPALLFTLTTNAQPFNWQWSTPATGAELEPGIFDLAVDALGNSYVTGQFWGTAQWGTLPAVTAVGQYDVYVVKYAADGTALWVAQGGGDAQDVAKGITVDAAGNVYITGYTVSPTADFGSTTLSLQGTMDIVVAKLNANGQWQWAKHFGSNYTGDEAGEDIVATTDGGTYITGAFKYYLEFDVIDDLEGCSTIQDLFLLHLDTDGEPVWARNPDCTHDASYGVSTGQELALDGLGNLYLGARFRGDTNFFETDTLLNYQPSGQAHDCMLAKYTLDGDYQWVRWIGGYGYDDVKALATDIEGNCYVAMHREDEYDLPEFEIPVSGTIGDYRAVLLKTSPTGEFLWWQRLGNSGYDHTITSLALDAQSDILLSGSFQDRFEFDEVVFDGSGPHYGTFVARFSNDNTVEEVYATRDNASRSFQSLGLDGVGNIYIAGGFTDTLTFPGLPTMDVAERASFVARSGDMPTTIAMQDATGEPVIFPSPSSGRSTVRSEVPFSVLRIWNATGALVAEQTFAPARSWPVALEEPGAYTISITLAGDGVRFGKLVVVR